MEKPLCNRSCRYRLLIDWVHGEHFQLGRVRLDRVATGQLAPFDWARYSLNRVDNEHAVRHWNLETGRSFRKNNLVTVRSLCLGLGNCFTPASLDRSGYLGLFLCRLSLERDSLQSSTDCQYHTLHESNHVLWNETKLHSAFSILGALTNVEPLALKLNDVPLFQVFNLFTGQRGDAVLGLGVEDILEIVILFKLLLGDEVVVLDKGNGNELILVGRGGEPSDLFGSLFEISLEVESNVKVLDGSRLVLFSRRDECVAPVHECDLFVSFDSQHGRSTNLFIVSKRGRVFLLDDEFGRINLLLFSNIRVLLVQWLGNDLDLFSVSSLDVDRHPGLSARHHGSTYILSSAIAQYRGAIGSMTLLLVVQIPSHSS